jgi:hypothetical protein
MQPDETFKLKVLGQLLFDEKLLEVAWTMMLNEKSASRSSSCLS